MAALTVILELYGDPKFIECFYKAMHPDNTVIPEYMLFKEELGSGSNCYKVLIKVPLRSRYIRSVRQTVDEILGLTTMTIRISR